MVKIDELWGKNNILPDYLKPKYGKINPDPTWEIGSPMSVDFLG